MSRDGVWALREAVPDRRRRPLNGLKMLLAASAGAAAVAVGVAVVTLSQPSWAQSTSWRRAAPNEASLLRDAVVAGSESGLPLYPCRAFYADAMLAGRYRSDFGGCHIAHDGKEVEVTPFEVLSPAWTDAAEGAAVGALVAGEVADGLVGKTYVSRPVSPCRVSYQGAVHPGSWPAGDKACSFGFGGRAVASQTFSVMQSAPWMVWTPGVALALADGALIGGEEGGEPFYICRAPTPRGTMAGKIKVTSPGCSVAYEGRELVETRFELLMPRWRVSSGGAVPVGAVAGGREGTSLQYVCRGRSRSTLQLGQVSERKPGCRIGMQGSEVVLQDYEVLSE